MFIRYKSGRLFTKPPTQNFQKTPQFAGISNFDEYLKKTPQFAGISNFDEYLKKDLTKKTIFII